MRDNLKSSNRDLSPSFWIGLTAVLYFVIVAGCGDPKTTVKRDSIHDTDALPVILPDTPSEAIPSGVGTRPSLPDEVDFSTVQAHAGANLVQESIQDMNCNQEKDHSIISISTQSFQQYWLNIPKVCNDSVVDIDTIDNRVPADIIFVLDITASMSGNIATVKDNINTFVVGLNSRGWDARFAAIGFRDQVDATISFTNAAGMQTGLAAAAWNASGGGDSQEAGQAGLLAAINLFKNSGRADADKVILFVTDNPSYNGTQHSDFSVTDLVGQVSTSGLTGLKLYCSAHDRTLQGASAPAQCIAIRSQSGIPGANFPFPLTSEVFLNQFSATFETVETVVPLLCFVTAANISASLHPSQGPYAATLNEAQNVASIHMGLGTTQAVRDAGTFPFSMTTTVERCCVREGGSTCEKEWTSTPQVKFQE